MEKTTLFTNDNEKITQFKSNGVTIRIILRESKDNWGFNYEVIEMSSIGINYSKGFMRKFEAENYYNELVKQYDI